jgi:heme/copper-type cytochrome/quinol oxidase subunit 3
MRVSVFAHHASSFVARMVTFSMELTIAAAVIFGAVFVGHELREWREWYWALPPAFDQGPSAPAVTEP